MAGLIAAHILQLVSPGRPGLHSPWDLDMSTTSLACKQPHEQLSITWQSGRWMILRRLAWQLGMHPVGFCVPRLTRGQVGAAARLLCWAHTSALSPDLREQEVCLLQTSDVVGLWPIDQNLTADQTAPDTTCLRTGKAAACWVM